MNELIASLIQPSAFLPPDTIMAVTRVRDWSAFCTLARRTGCAPLIHQRLRDSSANIPQDVLAWLRSQHDRTAENNSRLVDELNAVILGLTARGIPSLVLKGPVLAFLGAGLEVRPFRDLDLLVRPRDLSSVSSVLNSLGFGELRIGDHDYHNVYIKTAHNSATVVEMHFDLIDRERRHGPDVQGVWDRAVHIDIRGHAIQTPSIADHLLLTIMQLPHHHWAPRLIVDIGHVATRWRNVIEWTEFAHRARAWGMRVLAGSTLHAAASLLRFALSPQIAQFAEPENYMQRVQWHLAQRVLSEQFRLDPHRLNPAAPFLFVDRPSVVLTLAIRNAFMPKHRNDSRNLTHALRRLHTGVRSVPSLLGVLSRTAVAKRPRNPRIEPENFVE